MKTISNQAYNRLLRLLPEMIEAIPDIWANKEMLRQARRSLAYLRKRSDSRNIIKRVWFWIKH